MESTEKRWYVPHTYSGYETELRAIWNPGLSQWECRTIFLVVVPEEKVRQVKDGEAKEIEEKLSLAMS